MPLIASAKLGVEHQRAGRFEDAMKCYSRALSMDPNNVEAHTARGALYTKL